MIRVGFVFNHAAIIGGGEISFIDLADEIRNFGFEPVGIVPGDGEVRSRLDALNIKTVVAAWPPIGIRSVIDFPRRIYRTAELFQQQGLNLVHANGARCMLYAGPAAKRLFIPCVWHVRVLARDRLLDRVRARYASAIIVNSGAVASTLKPYALPSRKIDVVYNGLDLEKFNVVKPLDLSREFGLPAAPVVLAAGRFSRWKGFADLIRACAILRRKSIAFTCLLVGKALPADKDYECHLVTLARQYGLTNVVFTGWRDDVPAIMKSASVMVLPSHGEPFGRVIIEAWACGLPVVATNEGGPAEIIDDKVNGMLVRTGNAGQMADAIEMILRD
ncbi:MAG: glycosyltransferase, partial [Kiritimatiellae bacterium]|nr:glycosyltransferase [Kiritimatiellia bacterium]